MKIIKEKVAWIDILKPTRADLEYLKKQHKFHPIILDELLHLSGRSRVEFYKSYLFITYHLPLYDEKLKTSRRAEIDFLITKDEVFTVHYENLEPLANFHRSISNNLHYKERVLGADTGRLIYYLIQEIISFSLRQLRHIEENIAYISQEIFRGREGHLLEKISHVKRDILDYSIISYPQSVLLNSLLDLGSKFFKEDVEIYFNDLIGDHLKVTQQLENYRQVIESLESTNSQILNAKTNRIMQRFTILAFLTFPLFLFTSLISIDFIEKYLTSSPGKFWLYFFGVAFIIIVLIIIFKKKKWL